jgi:hypothetical protein
MVLSVLVWGERVKGANVGMSAFREADAKRTLRSGARRVDKALQKRLVGEADWFG